MMFICHIFSLYIFNIAFYLHSFIANANNVGTVLFSASDIHKQCWSPEEIAILTTRMILEDLLPDVRVLTIDSDEYVDDIVDYFRLLIEATRKMCTGRKKHITMLALTDLLGGYLQHAVLPISREAYYAGIIDYLSMEKLIQLFEELKWFLRTNGQGWSLPIRNEASFDVQPIDYHSEARKCNQSCCRNLIYYKREPSKKRATEDTTAQPLFFPVPFLDSKVHPSAIAVPFKKFALRNIGSKKAAYLVMKYFIAVHRCFDDIQVDQIVADKFHNNLFTWVEKEVIPKLKDDKFYSAFGGILRVEETLRGLGAKVNEETCTEGEEGEEEVGAIPGGESTSRSTIILIVMLSIIFIWFILGTLFICYRMRSNNRKKDMPCKGPKRDGTCSGTPSTHSSGWSLGSKSSKRSTPTCRCCTSEKSSCKCSTSTADKSVEYTSCSTSESVEEKQHQRARSSKGHSTIKHRSSVSSPCVCPAVIDAKHSMKMLPSIPEMSENSSLKKSGSKSKRIYFESSSREDIPGSSNVKSTAQSKMRICVPDLKDVELVPCSQYSDKATSVTSSKSKSGKDLGTQVSESGVDEACSCKEDSTDDTAITANSPHIYACHSSLTGNYTTDQRYPLDKPCIFGYDFQTSSSSEDVSDEDTEGKTCSTK